jgi:hypothetical protein
MPYCVLVLGRQACYSFWFIVYMRAVLTIDNAVSVLWKFVNLGAGGRFHFRFRSLLLIVLLYLNAAFKVLQLQKLHCGMNSAELWHRKCLMQKDFEHPK